MTAELRIDDHVAYVTINRPEVMNALDQEIGRAHV